MKKTSIFLAICCFALAQLQAQIPRLSWADTIGRLTGGTFSNIHTDVNMVSDAEGNIYTVHSVNNAQLYLSKYTPSGMLVWQKAISEGGIMRCNAMTIDTKGNLYLTGEFRGTADVDGSDSVHHISSNGADDIFIEKLDSLGNLIWVRSFGDIASDEGRGIAVDSAGFVYVTGYFQGTVDFDPSDSVYNLSSGRGRDMFVQKLDSTGNVVWIRQMVGSESNGSDIYVDINQNIYLTGYLSGTVDFDPSDSVYNLSSPDTDIFVQKLDSTGNLVWVISIMGGWLSYSDGSDIYVDINQNIYITGYFFGTMDFDPSDSVYNLSSSGGRDIFIQKLDSAGNLVWATSIGGSSGDGGSSISIDNIGAVYLTGYFQGTVDFDPGSGVYNLSSSGSRDIFVQKLDNAGNLVWAKSIGGQYYDEGSSIFVSPDCGGVYVAGAFTGSVDFDPDTGATDTAYIGVSGSGNYSAFLLKLEEGYFMDTTVFACDRYSWQGNVLGSTGISSRTLSSKYGCDSVLHLDLTIRYSSPETRDTSVNCESFVWRDSMYTSTGLYRDSFTNSVGCDSILTLDLSIIDTVDMFVMQETSRLVARLEGAEYQWLDCVSSHTAIAGATNRIFTATTNGEYAVEVRDVCIDTSSCYTIMGLSVEALREPQGPLGIHIYPSPTEGEVFIELGQFSKQIFVVVRDVFGRVLQDEVILRASMTNILNTRLEVSSGMYYIEVSDDKGNRGVFRVVKQ